MYKNLHKIAHNTYLHINFCSQWSLRPNKFPQAFLTELADFIPGPAHHPHLLLLQVQSCIAYNTDIILLAKLTKVKKKNT